MKCHDGEVKNRPTRETIPDQPGCYQFLDEQGRVLYVGKARSLRNRVTSYFQDPRSLHPRTAQMVAAASKVDWVVTASEVDALELEHSLIQSFLPHYNIRLKDDKSYPWLALTMAHEWPRPVVTRGVRRKGTRYFGPFSHARSLRQTVDLLLPTFPVRSCPDKSSTATRGLVVLVCSSISNGVLGRVSAPSNQRCMPSTSKGLSTSSQATSLQSLERLSRV